MSDSRRILTWKAAMGAYWSLRRYGVSALRAWRCATDMAHPDAVARHAAEREQPVTLAPPDAGKVGA